MAPTQASVEDRALTSRTIEVGLRVGLVAVLVYGCLKIMGPFIHCILWGIVLAVAVQPLYVRMERALGGRPKLAAGLLVLAALLLLTAPTVALTVSLVDTAASLSGDLRAGSVAVPPPPASVAEWPIIGERLYAEWTGASANLEVALAQIAPQLKAIGRWLLTSVATTGVGILMFILSIVIAGVFLANGPRAAASAIAIAQRIAGDRGADLTTLAAAIVQSVTRGILGVALIQSLLAGIGLLAVGVPAAGLWALLVLLLAVVQLPSLLVLGPIIVYVFSTSSTLVATVFAIWSVLVGLSDNFLKPLLLGRGVDVPMLVIFMGAIGGFVLDGIIGLFLGAVMLALGYKLFDAWLGEGEASVGPLPPSMPT
ncbi:MAG: AI-2E family transporter [Myxococcales bacterium]|nr:AI-2E family transporter [Myxococcales bacterium]MDH5307319.1 AI-2E family transporter [Myxococcales bacterium]MDH5566461.1 AI-2E family transporter [Myxococcales bacterium]